MINQLDLPEHQLVKTPARMALVKLLFALIFLSSAAIIIRFSEQEITPCATAFNRFWITTVVLGLWNGIKAIRYRLTVKKPIQYSLNSGRIWGELLAVGIFLSADLILWAWSLTQTSVANATLLANLTPLFTTLGAWLVWGRRCDSRFLMGMVVAVGGAIAIGLGDLQITTDKVQGDIAAILAAVSFGVYLLTLEQLQTRLNATTIVFWSSAIATVVTLPFVLTTQERIFPSTWQGWLAVITLALICQVLGQGLLVYSLNRLSSQFIALFLLLEPVLAAIGAGVFFSERIGMLNWMAFAIVLLGMYLALSSQSAVKTTVDYSEQSQDTLTAFDSLPWANALHHSDLSNLQKDYAQELPSNVEGEESLKKLSNLSH